jgi:hypothetical protein
MEWNRRGAEEGTQKKSHEGRKGVPSLPSLFVFSAPLRLKIPTD